MGSGDRPLSCHLVGRRRGGWEGGGERGSGGKEEEEGRRALGACGPRARSPRAPPPAFPARAGHRTVLSPGEVGGRARARRERGGAPAGRGGAGGGAWVP